MYTFAANGRSVSDLKLEKRRSLWRMCTSMLYILVFPTFVVICVVIHKMNERTNVRACMQTRNKWKTKINKAQRFSFVNGTPIQSFWTFCNKQQHIHIFLVQLSVFSINTIWQTATRERKKDRTSISFFVILNEFLPSQFLL